MDTVNTNVNMTDGGSNTTVNTSSSINSSTNSSYSSPDTPTNTSSYQTNNTGDTNNVEEYDLSLDESSDSTDTTASIDTGESAETGGEQSKKNILSRVGEWFVNTAKSIYDTGAKVVHDVKTWCSENLLGPGNNLFETAANVAKNVFRIGAKVGELFVDGYTALLSTEAVLLTSIASGVAKLGEHIVDGIAWAEGKIVHGASWLLGSMVGWFNEDAGNAVKDFGRNYDQAAKEFIAEDWVGKANQWFYEQTPVGQYLNEHSLMKYDSKLAKGIQNVSEKAAEIAAATALTIFTGGAATFAIGALYGLGKSAESTYQQNGTDTSLLQEGMIALSGAVTGLSWMATGKLGKGFIEIGKTASALGTKEVISQLSKEVLCKDFWKNAFKEGLTGWNGVGNYVSSAMMTGEKILPYIRGEKEWTAQAVGELALAYLGALGLNIAEDALRGYVTNFTISDDNAIKLAEKVIDPNDGAKLSDYTNLSDESVRKITDCMTGAEVADQLKHLEDGDVSRVVSFLDKTQKEDLGLTLGVKLIDGEVSLKDIAKIADETVSTNALKALTEEELITKVNAEMSNLSSDELARISLSVDRNIAKKVITSIPSKEDRIKVIFAQEKQLANGKFTSTFTSYREHAELHTELVQEYAKKLGVNIDDLSDKELEELSYAAYFHDLGMAGGIYKDGDNWVETLSGGKARKNHPLNSAVAIIEYDLAPEGSDKEKIALLAMSHSKSTSGIKHMSDPDEWKKCVDTLDEALEASSGKGLDPVAKSRLYAMIDDPEEFAKLQKQAMCIRDGDAMSAIAKNALGDTIMQTGRTVHVEVDKLGSADEVPPKYKIPDGDDDASFVGSDRIHDTIVETGETIDSNMSKTIHAGELNVGFDSTIDSTGTVYHATATIQDALSSPEANIYAINERIGEVITYDHLAGRSYTIEVPVPEGSKLGNWYRDAVDAIRDGLAGSKGSDFTKNLRGITKSISDTQASKVRTLVMAAQQASDRGQLAQIVSQLGLSPEESAKALRRCQEFFDELEFIEKGIKVVFK